MALAAGAVATGVSAGGTYAGGTCGGGAAGGGVCGLGGGGSGAAGAGGSGWRSSSKMACTTVGIFCSTVRVNPDWMAHSSKRCKTTTPPSPISLRLEVAWVYVDAFIGRVPGISGCILQDKSGFQGWRVRRKDRAEGSPVTRCPWIRAWQSGGLRRPSQVAAILRPSWLSSMVNSPSSRSATTR